MKEKYTNLTDFINDIMAAAEEASKDIVSNFKKEEAKEKSTSVKNSKLEEEPIGWKDVNACSVNTSVKKPCEETLKQIPGNITIDNNDHYILNEMVNGWPTYNEQHLIFEQFTKDGYKIPGITDSQILSVLYHRYRNDPKKLDLVRQLMN